MPTWRDKAHEVIAALCYPEWKKANTLPNGHRRKKHKQYSVPEDAKMLVDCLARDDEETAKAYFLKRAMFGETYREIL